MSVDVGSEVERRARVHAALADPARLRIVDALSLGDVSPSDLQNELRIGSNLLAHHLRTLERAGLVTRRRSEADRRRTYLHLDQTGLAELLPSPEPRPAVPRVVFVCTANTARSQLAAALWSQASAVPATSAGTHPAEGIAPGAVAVARRRGLQLERVRPRALEGVLEADDFMITVCDNAHEELRTEQPTDLPRLHWSVADPVRGNTDADFDAAYDDLAARVAHLSPHLTAP